MTRGGSTPAGAPTPADRLAARARPAKGRVVMLQQWRDLLFLHWQVPPDVIQSTLPDGLFVDTHEGRAFLGVVPFFMRRIRPRFLPPLPGLSYFLELNVRTYVHDRAGIPGVWFYSLDANQPIAVAIARRFFHLPYIHARMSAGLLPGGRIRYQCTRREPPGAKPSEFDYAPGPAMAAPAPGSLEFFLVERYRLYAGSGHRLWRGAVSHAPYPLHEARLHAWSSLPLALAGFQEPGRAPDHALLSPGVQVDVFPLEPA